MKKYIMLILLALVSSQADCQDAAMDVGSLEHKVTVSEKAELKEEKMKEVIGYFRSEKENSDVNKFSKKIKFRPFARAVLKEYPNEPHESIVAHYLKYGAEHIIRSKKYDQNFNLIENLAFHPLITKYFVGQKMDPESKRAVFFRQLIKPKKTLVKKAHNFKNYLTLRKKSKSTEKMEEEKF